MPRVRVTRDPRPVPRRRGATLPGATGSPLEALFASQLTAVGIHYRREVVPLPPRRWRCDFQILDAPRLLVEIEGAVWTQGRHTRGSGFVADMEKYNALTLAGWRVLRVSGGMVQSGDALRLVEQAIQEAA